MKLLAKTSLIYLLSALLVFLAGGWIFYLNLRNIMDEEANERLYEEKMMVEKFVKENHKIPVTDIMTGDLISFTPTGNASIRESLKDTFIYSASEEEMLPFHCLKFPVKIDEENYAVSISKPLFESDDLIEAILTPFALLLLILLLVTFVAAAIASKKLWKPFFDTLSKLRAYRIDQHEPLLLSKTSTHEFRELNNVLQKMTEKVSADYNNLKAFTENASHELQTPLSVIMASAENMLQQPGLDEKQAQHIQQIQQTARRLSKLNQTLLLLAKIDNRQFEEKEHVDIRALINAKLDLYSELIAHKNISMETNMEEAFMHIHPMLADVMISNLLTNAIRHNKGGKIQVKLQKDLLSICNSGDALSAPEKLFGRFYKENISSESTGLGLALVRQIAETNGMQISYTYSEGMHCFRLIF